MHRAKSTDQQLSLRGRISIKDMGTRVEKQSTFSVSSKRQKKLDGAFNSLYANVQSYLEDISPQVLDSACKILISVLGDEAISDQAKKQEAESTLGPLEADQYSKLATLVARVNQMEGSEITTGELSSSESEGDDSDHSDQEEPQADSDSEDEEATLEIPEWCSNPHYLKQLLVPTSVKPAMVLDVLAKDDPEQELVKLFNFEFLDIVEILLTNRLQIYWYTMYLTAETGLDRENALNSIKNLDLEPSQGSASMESIDLESLIRPTNSRFTASSDLLLPEGSEKSIHGSYEQYSIPFLQHAESDEPLVSISSLPDWAQPVFNGIKTLNRVQSRVYEAAFNSTGNLLLCAPTGAGKTNAALLAMLQCLDTHKGGKIVYISPLKALVQEQVRTFSTRLQMLGITVAELSGDSNMTSDEIAATRVIVTTPEKWDIITRKTFDVAYTSQVKLVIIDEIHLLHDPRGVALENVVSRSLMLGSDTRLVGLSATLPNYQDVASFLQAEHCFYFDSSYRPCPLQQQFCGITEKTIFKQHQALNSICLEKVLQFYNDHQSIVFVHSRKDTQRTAQYLLDNSDVFPNLSAPETDNAAFKNLLERGIGIHHAGLSRNDRSLVERLFAERKLKVLVSTATLAWGVNLPAHAVIIKGTQVYNPQEGDWQELSPQDILQMLGRAGRPGFDTFGEGIVITLHDKLAYYMSVLTSQFPIESQLIGRLADSINAEVCLGTVRTLDDAVKWLGKTYYFTRLKSDPVQYRAGIDYDDDGEYNHRRKVIVHSALKWLSKAKMVHYDGETASPTPFGKIAASFYISPSSMALYMKQLKPHMGPVDIFSVFSRSKEFESIPLRKEEYLEVEKLGSMVPVPVRDKIDEPKAKVNILLQSYISRLQLVGMALSADMVYITQSASRLFRAMFELALAQKWPLLCLELHQLYLMVDKKMWLTSSPLRQYQYCPPEVLRKTESSPTPWSRYLEAQSAHDTARIIRSEKYADEVYTMIQKFPHLGINVMHQPITPTLLRLNIELTPDFRWDRQLHHRSQKFLLLVYDGDYDEIFHWEWLLVTEGQTSVAIQVTVPVIDPLTPVYYAKVISDSWLHADSEEPINLESLVIPDKFAAPTPVKLIDPVDVSHLDFPLGSSQLSLMESQAYHLLYATDRNAFIGMNGSFKTLTELVVARHSSEPGIITYMHPNQDYVQELFNSWKDANWFSSNMGILTGELPHDLKVLGSSKLVLSSVENMDRLTRKWQQYEPIQAINVAICDSCHLIGSQDGYLAERTVIRLKFMATQLDRAIRFVAFSYPVAGSSLGSWFGASKGDILNYLPGNRMGPATSALELSVEAFDQRDLQSRQKMMFKQVNELQPELVFVYSRDQCIELAKSCSQRTSFEISTRDKAIEACAKLGYPFIYSGMDPDDFEAVIALRPQTLIATADMAHRTHPVSKVVVCNTQYYDFAQNGAATDYTAVKVIDMIANALEKAYVFTTAGKAAYYNQFLCDPLPVESHLMYYLADTFMVEVAEQVIGSPESALDWLTYSFFFQKLRINPSYYGLEGLDEDTINEYLSELTETTVEELSAEGIVEVAEDDEMTLTPLDGAFISSAYDLSFATISALNKLKPSSNLRDIFALVCSIDFDIEVDRKQHAQLVKLGQDLPFTTSMPPTNNKVQVLLQLHLSRSVPPQWLGDLKPILLQAISCVKACVDILSGSGSLNALVALDLHQMLVQGLWDRDSPLKQIPFVDSAAVERCLQHDIKGIGEFLGIEEDEVRNAVLGFDETDPRMVEVADFCNEFPAIDIEQVQGTAGSVFITVTRDIEEEAGSDLVVHARYPYLCTSEQWYIIVGSLETRELYGARRVVIDSPEETFEVPLTLDDASGQNLSVWCICSGYLDADKEGQVILGAS